MIPLDPIGYAVNPSTGTIHTRYADHAGNAHRTRTEKGVLTLLDGAKAKVCATCYPSPQYSTPAPRSAPQQRRSGAKRKLTGMEKIEQATRRLATNNPDA